MTNLIPGVATRQRAVIDILEVCSSLLTRRYGSVGCALVVSLLTSAATAVGADVATNAANALDATVTVSQQRYKIAVVDLMILKRQKLGAFQLAKDIGADGVEIDMGGLGERDTFDNQLTNAATRQQFLDKARELGLEIPSLAMTGFFAQSFADRPTVPRMIQDCVDTMKAMGVKVAFLPLGVKGDLTKNPELRPAIVERLKLAGKIAERAGVVIGVETSLSAADDVKLLNDVGSSAIKIYFNFANAVKNGRDIPTELRTLGKDRICQIHCTNEDGVWLENDPKIDLPKIKQTLDEMDWRGWLVIERSRDAKDPRNVWKNFGANTRHLKSIFQPAGGP
jgi:sugar phosphate isomerase/epimerase